MTQEEFIEILDRDSYSYEIQGDKIVVTIKGYVYLRSLTSLPPDVEFKNGGYVDLNSLKSLPPGVEFRNEGNVYLESLTSLPPGVEFSNEGDVNLYSLIGGWFGNPYGDAWNGNIKGIDSKMLLNGMIKRGIFL